MKKYCSKGNTYYYDVVKRMVRLMEIRDSYTADHSRRVAETSLVVAQHFGLTDTQCKQVYFAADVHDIGKIGIPDSILLKRGSLTEEEGVVMKQHPEIGARILMKSAALEQAAQIVYCHHERYDGKGYPNGLCGEEIPLEAHIITVCDSIDAMKSHRVYRDPLPDSLCREEILTNVGIMYDPQVARFVLEYWYLFQERKCTCK